jgi:nucleotide-binding universal stress UspA family protein
MLRRIVVGYDFSEAADDALAWTADLARATGAQIAVVHVIDASNDGTPAVDEARRNLVAAAQDLGLEVTTHVEVGAHVAAKLVAYADDTDADALVVAMSEGNSVRRWFLGSVADEVLQKAHCPVIAYRGEDT